MNEIGNKEKRHGCRVKAWFLQPLPNQRGKAFNTGNHCLVIKFLTIRNTVSPQHIASYHLEFSKDIIEIENT